MGNTPSSKDKQTDDTVDLGALTPQGGIYASAQQDWNHGIVSQLIIDRKLAPFYRPLEDYEEEWDDDKILAARKIPEPDANTSPGGGTNGAGGGTSSHGYGSNQNLHASAAAASLKHVSSKSASRLNVTRDKEPPRNYEAQVYRGAVECPICFMYYPPNVNHTRCCDQAICTECFVQIKRADPTTTHIVSEPASCPYCVQPNFGVTYTPPQWRAGIGSGPDGTNSPLRPDFSSSTSGSSISTDSSRTEGKRRKRSVSHTSREVVTIDQIRPDWEQKLNAVRAAVARRANRRIVMRQVGDQLIPVGITSGRIVPLPPGTEGVTEDGSVGNNGGSRRRRRDRNNNDLNHLLGSMGMGGQDLEELMIMEAMRLSMVEENDRQRRQQEEEARNAQRSGSTSLPTTGSGPLSNSSTNPITADNSPASIAGGLAPPMIPTIVSHSRSSSHPAASPSPLDGISNALLGVTATASAVIGGTPSTVSDFGSGIMIPSVSADSSARPASHSPPSPGQSTPSGANTPTTATSQIGSGVDSLVTPAILSSLSSSIVPVESQPSSSLASSSYDFAASSSSSASSSSNNSQLPPNTRITLPLPPSSFNRTLSSRGLDTSASNLTDDSEGPDEYDFLPSTPRSMAVRGFSMAIGEGDEEEEEEEAHEPLIDHLGSDDDTSTNGSVRGMNSLSEVNLGTST